jgi:pimeloyl-ACP methyl ester carboxylesterase
MPIEWENCTVYVDLVGEPTRLDSTLRVDHLIPASLVLLATLSGWTDRPRLVRFGGDPARGVLVNHTPSARPFDPPNPTWPTVVFVHGFNPLPRLLHFPMAAELAEVLARRGGPPLNVLGWNWNAATNDSLSHRVNDENAVRQGHALAAELARVGVDPWRLHLIGHSAGGLVATSAARDLAGLRGRLVLQLTLLDPATCYHDLLFNRLAAGSCAQVVENNWAPGLRGYGRAVVAPGVRNFRVDGWPASPGRLRPLRPGHLQSVRWYLDGADDSGRPSGLNTSQLLAPSGPRARTARRGLGSED